MRFRTPDAITLPNTSSECGDAAVEDDGVIWAVLWGCAAIGAVGIFLGIRYRISAMLAATWLLLIGLSWSAWQFEALAGDRIATVLVPVLALQIGYVVGALLAHGLAGTQPRSGKDDA